MKRSEGEKERSEILACFLFGLEHPEWSWPKLIGEYDRFKREAERTMELKQ